MAYLEGISTSVYVIRRVFFACFCCTGHQQKNGPQGLIAGLSHVNIMTNKGLPAVCASNVYLC